MFKCSNSKTKQICKIKKIFYNVTKQLTSDVALESSFASLTIPKCNLEYQMHGHVALLSKMLLLATED